MYFKNKIFTHVVFLSIWTNLFYQIIKIGENKLNKDEKLQINNSELNKKIDKLNKYFSF